jgi:hypothetical protein
MAISLTLWQAFEHLFVRNQIELGFFAIAVSSFILFLLAFDIARFFAIRRIASVASRDDSLIDRILEEEIIVPARRKQLSSLLSDSDDSLIDDHSSVLSCRAYLSFILWRISVFVPFVIFLLIELF